MVPHRWVLFKAFHKNVEGLAGFSGTDIEYQHRMLTEMTMKKMTSMTLLAGLMALTMMAAGCSSDPAAPEVEAPVVLDTAPPAIPTGLAAYTDNMHVKVGWLDNTTDGDFEGFMLYRLAFGQAWPLLDTPTRDTHYVDRNPLSRPCSYAVTAIDANGNESAWTEVFYQGLPDQPQVHED